jgi:hypothetical protein
MTGQRSSLVTPKMLAGLLIVSAFSLLAFLILNAYAPDLRAPESDEANALSKSAVGYAGLHILAEHSGVPASLSRDPNICGNCGLTVLAPQSFGNPHELAKAARSEPCLIILPKWLTASDPTHDGWVMKIATMPPAGVEHVLSELVTKPKISQVTNSGNVTLQAVDVRFKDDIPKSPTIIDRLQTVFGENLVPIIADSRLKGLLLAVRGTQIYILSDPDFANNSGLHDRATALLAYNLLRKLRVGSGPIKFDLTLNGFRSSPSLLRAVFSPPFLGATLCAIVAAVLLAFHAVNRFGTPQLGDRPFAFGKRALADNTATVITLLHREPSTAPPYAQAMLNFVGAKINVSREQMTETGWLGALERRAGLETSFSTLRNESDLVRDKTDLLNVANKLYLWRQRVLNERR